MNCSEIINIVKHLSAYPNDSVDNALRNTFDFDVYRPDAIEKLEDVLIHHGLIKSGGLSPQAARDMAQKRALEMEFEAQGSPPEAQGAKFGDEDPDNGGHSGGNQFSGGVSAMFRFLSYKA